MELDEFKKKFYKICEILQNNVSKIVYKTINNSKT